MQWGPLDDSQAKSIIDEIRTRHDKALLGRRDSLRSQMFTAIHEAGAPEHGLRADGLISVKGRNGRQYAVWITTRAPELPDFHVTHTGSRFPAGLVGVVVGHRDLLEPEALQRFDWLSGVCKLVFVDEGQMVAAAGRMAMGTL